MGAAPSVPTLVTKKVQVSREDPLQLVALAVQVVGHPSAVGSCYVSFGIDSFAGLVGTSGADGNGGLGANTVLGTPSRDWQGSFGGAGVNGGVGGGGGGGGSAAGVEISSEITTWMYYPYRRNNRNRDCLQDSAIRVKSGDIVASIANEIPTVHQASIVMPLEIHSMTLQLPVFVLRTHRKRLWVLLAAVVVPVVAPARRVLADSLEAAPSDSISILRDLNQLKRLICLESKAMRFIEVSADAVVPVAKAAAAAKAA